jgi:hypothetical protein
MEMQQIIKMLANQANAKANQDLLTRMEAKIDANRESNQELQGMINANRKDLKEDIKSIQVEIRSTICAFRSELKETIQHEMKAVIQPICSELDEMTACDEATETEPNPGMMQSIEEHHEIPKEDAAVMPVRGPGSVVGSAIWPWSTTRK